jgi:myo-inositol 2-dehydrogenase/D-chiro-inositol 1-dehydrogenase
MSRWNAGPASVYSELDDFVMLFTCASGQHCAFSSCAHTSWAFPFERVELYGDHAQIVTEEMEKVSYASGLGQPIVQHDFFQLSIPDKWGYREEDRLFVDAILAGTPPPVTAEDGYRPWSWSRRAICAHSTTASASELPL